MTFSGALADGWVALSGRVLRWAGVAVLALFGFVIPIDPSLVSVMTAAVLLIWLLRGQFLLLPSQVKDNSVVRAALILFAVLALGCSMRRSILVPRYRP